MAALDAFDALILPHAPACPVPTVEWAVRLTCIDFCNRVELVTTDVVVNTVADQATYDPLPPGDVEARRVLGVWRASGELKNGSPALPGDPTGVPSRFYLTASGALGLAPIPSGAEPLTTRLVLRPTIDATTVPDALAEQYLETIASGALARLHRMPGQPWTDFNLAQLRQHDYDHACGIAQWQVDGRSRGSLPLRTSPSPI